MNTMGRHTVRQLEKTLGTGRSYDENRSEVMVEGRSHQVVYDMMWLKAPTERCCGNCGVVVERWVLHNDLGHRVAEATFCSVCYPDVERLFHTPDPARDAA